MSTIASFARMITKQYLDFENEKIRLNILSFEQSVFVKKQNICLKLQKASFVSVFVTCFRLRWLDNARHASLRSVSNQTIRIPKPDLSIFKGIIVCLYASNRLFYNRSQQTVPRVIVQIKGLSYLRDYEDGMPEQVGS